MLAVIVLTIVMLYVAMPIVVILSVVAPNHFCPHNRRRFRTDNIMYAYMTGLVPILLNFFSSLQKTRPNKLKCLYLAITF
jgi:hypothetical protein